MASSFSGLQLAPDVEISEPIEEVARIGRILTHVPEYVADGRPPRDTYAAPEASCHQGDLFFVSNARPHSHHGNEFTAFLGLLVDTAAQYRLK